MNLSAYFITGVAQLSLIFFMCAFKLIVGEAYLGDPPWKSAFPDLPAGTVVTSSATGIWLSNKINDAESIWFLLIPLLRSPIFPFCSTDFSSLSGWLFLHTHTLFLSLSLLLSFPDSIQLFNLVTFFNYDCTLRLQTCCSAFPPVGLPPPRRLLMGKTAASKLILRVSANFHAIRNAVELALQFGLCGCFSGRFSTRHTVFLQLAGHLRSNFIMINYLAHF